MFMARLTKIEQDFFALSCQTWVLLILAISCKMLLLDLAKTTFSQDLVSTCILLRLSKMTCKSCFLGTLKNGHLAFMKTVRNSKNAVRELTISNVHVFKIERTTVIARNKISKLLCNNNVCFIRSNCVYIHK